MTTRATTTKGGRPRGQRPIPQRTCTACRREGAQSSFVRLVRLTDEAGTRVEVDEGRRHIAGRGAYLCRQASCWDRGLKGALSHSLRTSIDGTNREALSAYGARFAPTENTDSSDEDSNEHESEDA